MPDADPPDVEPLAVVLHLSTHPGWRYRRPSTTPPRCAHGRDHGRFCTACVAAQRRLARVIDELVDASGQVTPPSPSTYGLTADQLRAEANRLVAAGWSPGEVRQVLAVEPRRAVIV